jgi:geranylgeranyl diphosphate synthase, type I
MGNTKYHEEKNENENNSYMNYRKFLEELSETEKLVTAFILEQASSGFRIKPPVIETGTLSYVKHGGKRLRPSVLMLSCMAVGGTKEMALPAAAAVELFHTWTLVHDDIIDNDNLRRGAETVHITAGRYGEEKLKLEPGVAKKYGVDSAILTGDIQHGWSVSLLSDNLPKAGVRHEVALHLITLLQVNVLRTLMEGEMLDVEFGLCSDVQQISDDQILDMLWMKTGILYEYCGIAGALIGKNSLEYDEQVDALKEFCSLCGTAFQVRDDILGLVGKEAELGKPVGSDIREGKKTLLVREALTNANESQKAEILKILGNSEATGKEIEKITKLIADLGGVEKARKIARDYVTKALPKLDHLPSSSNRELLYDWANYMIDREY